MTVTETREVKVTYCDFCKEEINGNYIRRLVDDNWKDICGKCERKL